jgi:hypothetical protein
VEQIIRITHKVNMKGLLTLRIPEMRGMEVEAIILPRLRDVPPDALERARLQSQTGFATQVLGDPAEDVWNDL